MATWARTCISWKRPATLRSQKRLSAISRKPTLRSPKRAGKHLRSTALHSERFWKVITILAAMDREINRKDTLHDTRRKLNMNKQTPAGYDPDHLHTLRAREDAL